MYERSQATGFATKWSQYCTGELKLNSITASRSQSIKGTGVQPSNSEFSDSTLAQGADINIVQYLGIAADEPERIKRHQKPDIILPLVEVGWDEAYCRQWCEENDLLSPIYTDSARGGCWFCHNQGLEQLRLLRKNYPDLWKLLLKWDKDSPVSFKPDGHTVHDYDLRFRLEDEGKVPKDRKFRWKMLQQEGDDLSLIVYDCEVFAHDWLVVFKDRNSGQYTVIHNDNAAVKEFITEDSIYCGFNSKHYDFFIIKAICTGATPEEIKELNDFIIGGGQGWEHPLIRGSYFYFNSIDIKDDMQMGLSLKAIEGHLGLSVEETTVPFDIDRPLTESELQETIHYCKHDVDTTDNLVGIRKEYLKSKIQVGRMVGISDAKAMSMTNAKLTAALLKASPVPHDDERNYSYPPNLVKDYIPPEVFEFFDQMHDPSIADKDLFKSKINFEVGGCPCVIGFGGIHGAIPTFQEEAQGKRTIRNYDVASLYPSLMIKCGYTSRNIPSAATFEEVYHTRLAAKKSGDKATANALKLVLNTTYGAMLNKYNDLFDPLMGRSVCVSGQLFLLELASRYVEKITTLRLIQLNTDGVMVSLEDWELPILTAINDEWQQRTGFLLEEDVIQKIVQKDVNNYIEIKSDGSAKTKGGYLVRGIAPAGAFNINNNAVIVAKAIREFFVNGTPVEETIGGCDDIFQFQLIAKAGAKYREAYHLVDGEQQSVQKVNRVYATSDTRYGKLFKVKAEDDATAKIEMLPEHCIIDNDNHLTIEDVDKTFYIEMAKKRINDFLGIKPEKKPRGRKTTDTPKEPRRKSKMATAKTTAPKDTTALNAFQKVLMARVKFLEAGAKKTGKNMSLSFRYFELDDIIPVATPIFMELGLLPVVTFTEEVATMTIVNTDKPKDSVVFFSPMRVPEPNRGTNPVMALGSAHTYLRRYLYMVALDICEPDTINAQAGKTTEGEDEDDTPAPAPVTVRKPPVSNAERKEATQNLTAPDDNASPLQIRQLKNILIQLREADPANDALAAKIAEQTVGFTQISKVDCEKLITGLNAKLSGNTEG